MAKNVEDCLRRLNELEGRRHNWDSHWQEVAERVWPAADEFLTSRGVGEKRSTKIYDATAAMALEKFAAALESMLTPRAHKWHSLRSTDENLNRDPAVKVWFEEVARIMFQARNSPNAGYYSQMHEGYKSLGAFGNSSRERVAVESLMSSVMWALCISRSTRLGVLIPSTASTR